MTVWDTVAKTVKISLAPFMEKPKLLTLVLWPQDIITKVTNFLVFLFCLTNDCCSSRYNTYVLNMITEWQEKNKQGGDCTLMRKSLRSPRRYVWISHWMEWFHSLGRGGIVKFLQNTLLSLEQTSMFSYLERMEGWTMGPRFHRCLPWRWWVWVV